MGLYTVTDGSLRGLGKTQQQKNCALYTFENVALFASKACRSISSGHGQRGSLAASCACREKFGPRPIFKIFSLDQIRVDQEKKAFFSWSTRIWSSENILKIGRDPNFSLHAQGSPADRVGFLVAKGRSCRVRDDSRQGPGRPRSA